MLNPEWYLLQMNKKIRCLTFIFILFTNCSFDHVTGIWDASEDEKERIINLEKEEDKRVDVVKIYSSRDPYDKEFPSVTDIVLTKPKKIYHGKCQV